MRTRRQVSNTLGLALLLLAALLSGIGTAGDRRDTPGGVAVAGDEAGAFADGECRVSDLPRGGLVIRKSIDSTQTS